ncbi:3-hydroxy-5-methyl-1-naphthoate 3-O-methyltransferase [subsurface metagenome]
MSKRLSNIDPQKIENLTMSAYPFFAMLAGMQLNLFTALRDRSMTSKQIADSIGVNAKKLTPLLYALVAADLLTLERNLFSNSNEANHFLVPSSPNYMVDHACFNVDPIFMSWVVTAAQKTSDTIRSGIPQCKYDFSTMSEEQLEKGFRATLPIAVRAGHELVAKYDFTARRHLLDVAGGVGGLSIAITEDCPHMKATVVDLEHVIPMTQKVVDEIGDTDRVNVISADVVRDPLSGSYDVAVLRAIIQVLPPKDVALMLENVSSVVEAGGMIYVLGHVLDNSRISPIEEVWYSSLNINFYDIPGSYAEGEYRDWLSGAGFDPLGRDRLSNGDSVIVARKPK